MELGTKIKTFGKNERGGVLTMFAVIANSWMGKMSRKIKVEAHK